ncbi:MAG: hypothetical protein V7749_07140 [Cocleimonas sp.]
MKSLIIILSFFSIISIQTALALEADNTLNIGGAKIEVYFDPGVAEQDYNVNREQVMEWIDRSAIAVTKYFQRFPVKTLRMKITDGATRRRINGTAYHGDEPLIIINLHKSFNNNTLARDWVMVHEMVHLSFPPVKRRHHWLLEGLATYVEPIVRVRDGLLLEDKAWEWLVKGTPQGLPEAGNQGLDNTPTWGQRYWGGAIFFLIADMRIHQQTNNKFGIEHSLRAIQRGGGSMQLENDWEVVKALSMGDKATGTNVLVDLYNEMRDKSVMTDLDAIWKELGVNLNGNTISYNDTAKYADLRRSIYMK